MKPFCYYEHMLKAARCVYLAWAAPSMSTCTCVLLKKSDRFFTPANIEGLEFVHASFTISLQAVSDSSLCLVCC